eukprot:SAG31_NODE_39055_length_291_cov_0.807292_1_plen_41_part_10
MVWSREFWHLMPGGGGSGGSGGGGGGGGGSDHQRTAGAPKR